MLNKSNIHILRQITKFFFLFYWLIIVGCQASKKVNTANAQKVIRTARSFTGTPYRYGGTQKSGMDCSGLLFVSFQSVGVKLPRTSREQSRLGKAVSINHLLPGDLVFFSMYKNKITHVGLVTAVEGKNLVMFIHASTRRGVIEQNIFSDYYRKAFVKARRIL